MRLGCMALVAAFAVIGGLAIGSAWMGSRMLQEPEVLATAGKAEDGVRAQQKIYDVLRGGARRARGRAHQVILSEAELNAFLARHLAEAAKVPLRLGAVRLVGDGIVEIKGDLPLGQLLSFAELLPAHWLERPVWLHFGARASLEVGADRGQRRYLRLDIERLALGRQPLPVMFLRLLLNPAILSQLRWRLPETVESITIETQMVVIRTAS